ncbi:MAG: hypothetical protein DRP93_03050, partial [Candidatus Neomarinimicrobiota bacterium]
TSGGAPDQVEMIFKGDGGATDEIFWGVETYYDSGAGYYNWRLKGLTGFDPLETLDNQPGVSGDTYVPLQNVATDYWFYVTGRRVCMVAKTGSAYQFLYAGFIDQYSTPDEYPYPMLIMGSATVSTTVYNSNLLHYASSIHPGASAYTQPPAYLRDVTGYWIPIVNFTGTGGESLQRTTPNTAQVWPLCDATDLDSFTTSLDLRALTASTVAGGTPQALFFRSPNDGGTPSVPLISNCLLTQTPTTQLYGEIHNLFWCPLSDSVSAEDTVTDGVTADVYNVFNNIHRTDPWCGMAIKRE